MAFVSNLDIAFREVAERHRDRTALAYPGGERISYEELSGQVDRLAGLLWDRGLRRGDVAAIFHDKSPAAFAVMLACLRLGVIYANLDPDSPWERLHKILVTCQPDIVINAFPGGAYRASLAEADLCPVLELHDVRIGAADDVSVKCRPNDGGSPAYIMFTSGSTGMPKGAVMTHANLLWFISWAKERFAITSEDVLTNVNPMYFDNSVFDFYAAIFSGATLVPFTSGQVRDARSLVRLVSDAGCTIWFSVPSLLVYLLTTRALGAQDFPAVRKIVFGGEGFPKSKLRALYEMFGARAELENVYGPTECTCICSAYTIGERDFDDMTNLAPLGEIAQSFGFDILPLDEVAPDFGELFLRGPQVGLGYYNDPERTARAFVQNPRHALYTDIGYRTGDMVCRDELGRLCFKGRRDFQIKHMGYRIELEEIEAALNTLPDVKECAVIYRNLREGLGQIVAFAAMDAPPESDILRTRLAGILPSYMVPRQVVVLGDLPKNANGKVDRVALLNSAAYPAS